MGGNRFKRVDYNDAEINDLFVNYKNNKNKLQSLFSEKDKKTMKLWIYDLAIHMSRQSKAKLHHLINTYNKEVPKCPICKKRMKLCDLIEESNAYKNHCQECIDKHAWSTAKVLGKKALQVRGKIISDRKKEYYLTPEGKKFAEYIGTHNSKKMTEFYTTPEGKAIKEKNAKLSSERMKEKIANGEFTPNITNSRTQWSAKILIDEKVVKFRSSWEACFWFCNQKLSYETFRIPYVEDQLKRTYIADFFDYSSNTLYEIKPIGQWIKVSNKMQQVIDFCQANTVTFIWINEKNIMNYIDTSLFDDKNLPQLNMLIKGIKGIK